MRDFEVYEDGAGQLHFFVFTDRGDIEYAMIYLDPQDLRRDLAALREYGTAEDWAGMDMWDCPSTPVTPEEHYDIIRRDCLLVADQHGVYLGRADIAAKDALSGVCTIGPKSLRG